LIVLMNADAMAEVAAADPQRCIVKISDRSRNRAREDNAGNERTDFERKKNYPGKQQKIYQQRTDRSHGGQQAAIESRRT
jgi:hypothetical protein